MDHAADHEARQRSHQLANLRFHWGEAYEITWQDGSFRAARRDDGSPLWAMSYRDITDLITEDYVARPVPRDATHDC